MGLSGVIKCFIDSMKKIDKRKFVVVRTTMKYLEDLLATALLLIV